MATITLTDEQVIALFHQLPLAQKQTVLRALADDAQARREARMQHAQERLRELAAARGLIWDELDEDAREAFIDDLIHEDR